MRKRFGRSNAFLLEIVLDILLFAVLLTVSLHMIMKSHALTKKTQALYQAVELCESIADIYETGDGSYTDVLQYYPESSETGSGLILRLDSDFNALESSSGGSYRLKITPNEDAQIKGSSVKITLVDSKGNKLYSTKAFYLTTGSRGE